MAQNNIPVPTGPEEIVYKGNIVAVIHQPMKIGDKTRTFEVARRSPGTRSIVISPRGKILLTKEYRHDIDRADFRLPGGKICDTLDEYLKLKQNKSKMEEEAKNGAIKEVREEAGIEVKNAKLFCVIGTGATTMEHDLYYFVIKDFSILPKQDLGEGENIKVGWYPIPEVIEICLSDKFGEARSATVVLRYLHSLKKI